MNKLRSLIILILLSAVILAPLKQPSCIRAADASSPISFAMTPCSVQQILSSGCGSVYYWLEEESQSLQQMLLQSLIGLISFLLIFSKYLSPSDEVYRPPI
ncbi:hypothetical protein Lqui_0083 [Legionella quinlivanii]|uniref:Uncharacterized protein n=1 Tax=Legionella quinlivanii TaxID=45073 RepID=A0A0W0Y7P2_9GAMM|nr:hypothetical protein [Legionella quinlivanii]KTD52630.1 hypothetical protein Lqui_0083 [Legionella quinlivanii]MCW8451488.1 hypothetical protein [Legionella quinlivanii]SEG26036.1 hypothetical protein SAMN02746093_02343 [Legionella quinlivanii DSM 21216]STY10310.1 Uncharacterised protein [Legionella quinlivanii]